jgi:hypothetical protein
LIPPGGIPPGGIPPNIPANGSYYADGCAPPSTGNPGGIPPPPCICCIMLIAFCIFYGFIIYLIISGLLNIALSYGFESVIYFNIGLLLII